MREGAVERPRERCGRHCFRQSSDSESGLGEDRPDRPSVTILTDPLCDRWRFGRRQRARRWIPWLTLSILRGGMLTASARP